MVVGLYALLALHIYAYIVYIVALIYKRIGTWPALLWLAIGLGLVYNITFNHILATIIKPNGPTELRKVEKLRELYKKRAGRKSL